MRSKHVQAFSGQPGLDSKGIGNVMEYSRGEVVFAQRESCENVLYVQKGGVKLSVVSKAGREAVVEIVGPGEFFGEGCLAGQTVRTGTATAITRSTILQVNKDEMVRLLHDHCAVSDWFVSHLLSRNICIEQDLLDQLVDSSEKRLARALLLLARYGNRTKPRRAIPKISPDTLADMVGTTLSRITFLLDRFAKRGFIENRGNLKINKSLLSVVLHD